MHHHADSACKWKGNVVRVDGRLRSSGGTDQRTRLTPREGAVDDQDGKCLLGQNRSHR